MFLCVLVVAVVVRVCVSNPSQEHFELNQALLEGHPPPIYIEREFLLAGNVLLQSQRRKVYPELEDVDRVIANGTTCNATLPTKPCCRQWYEKSTVQYEECALAATGVEIVKDDFNVADIPNIGSCLYRDRRALTACCTWIARAVQGNVERCVSTRINIFKRGLRACVSELGEGRRECCQAMYLGRPLLYRMCKRGDPVYVNREAPCVYKDSSAQGDCCAQLFPTNGGHNRNRAYELCIGAVNRARKTGLMCYFEDSDSEDKEECCDLQLPYGEKYFESCMKQEAPPCRVDNFGRRVKCCQEEFPDDRGARNECMIREFMACQFKFWKNRLACCATMYRLGSHNIKHCLFQFLSVVEARTEKTRLSMCRSQQPPGSRFFEDCMLYVMKRCQSKSLHPRQLRACCGVYFSAGSAGHSACVYDSSSSSYIASIYESNPDLRPLSDATSQPEQRVQYCNQVFPELWQKYACLVDITFNDRNLYLYHFTLFTNTTVPGHVQFTCAILDQVERDACCASNFPLACTSFEVCMSWTPTAGLDSAVRPSTVEQEELERLLAGAMTSQQNHPHAAVQNNVESKELVLRFLEVMKIVEEVLRQPQPGEDDTAQDSDTELSQDSDNEELESSDSDASESSVDDGADDDVSHVLSGKQTLSSVSDIPAEVLNAYEHFVQKIYQATRLNQTAVFFHAATMAWMSCVTVLEEGSQAEVGDVYCARLDQAGGRAEAPQRKPLIGWECGAVNRVVQNTQRFVKIDRHSTFRQFGAVSSASPTSFGLVSQRSDYGTEMTIINLFALTGHCNLANMREPCNALCCDSYYAFGPLCDGKHESCIA